jgi:PIN domain nuclease of toxin-antitoxin system
MRNNDLARHPRIDLVGQRRPDVSSRQERMAAELQGGEIAISSITAWEIAMLTTRGRLSLSIDVTTWLAAIQQIERVGFLAIDNEIAVNAVELPGEFHKDPADRLIVATARRLGVPIVTADEKITRYPHVRTIW